VPPGRGGPHERGIKVGDVELAGLLVDPLCGEAEEEPESVPVGGEGVWAIATLGDEPVGEKRLQRWGRAGSSGRSEVAGEACCGQLHQLGRGPTGTSRCWRADVAEVRGQHGHAMLDLDAGAVSFDQTAHREAVPEAWIRGREVGVRRPMVVLSWTKVRCTLP
jgi:hypothetical protein